jgi:hypothetical protein
MKKILIMFICFFLCLVSAEDEAENNTIVKNRAKAQFVKLELKEGCLNIAEVEVFSGKKNIAVDGTATSSTVAFGGSTEKAIDGNTSGMWQDKSIFHSELEGNNWLLIDLKSVKKISKIIIWNRTDAVTDRILNTEVSLLDAEQKVVWKDTIKKVSEKISFQFK